MAGDTTALAEAILAMREAAAATDAVYRTEPPAGLDFNAARESLAVLIAVEEREQDAGRALLAALEGVPERLALLEDLAEVACWLADSCGTTQERRDDSYATVDTYSPQAKTMLDAALDALDALDGGGPG